MSRQVLWPTKAPMLIRPAQAMAHDSPASMAKPMAKLRSIPAIAPMPMPMDSLS